MNRIVAIALSFALCPLAAAAQSCPDNPDALGTARTLTADVKTMPRVGRKHFPQTLPLADKELVLTFDDGPWPTTTPKVLDALKDECVKATFFLLGRNAKDHPQIAKRELAEGHSVGHHSFSHPLLSKMSLDRVQTEIDRGLLADEEALYGVARTEPATPFFRFPGFASTPELLDAVNNRGLVVFGADVWASDWRAMSPEREMDLLLSRIEKAGRGIVLLHDTRSQTVHMLPALLRELKRRGYSIVHVVPPQA